MTTTRVRHLIGFSAALLFSACAPTYPGGLTEAEYNSLPPARRAELTIAQERADAARQANVESNLDRYESQRQFDEKRHKKNSYEPTIKLSPEETAEINSLTN